MILSNVLDEILAVLAAVPGMRPARAGVETGPPSPFVELPEITYGEGGPGLDRIPDLGLTVSFGQANNTKTFKSALDYASTTGAKSIPAALKAHTWVACYTLFVARAEPTIVDPRGAGPLIAYVFHLDITGAP